MLFGSSNSSTRRWTAFKAAAAAAVVLCSSGASAITITAESVQKLGGTMNGVQPTAPTSATSAKLLRADGPLGLAGPISTGGPLGPAGPLGGRRTFLTPADFIRAMTSFLGPMTDVVSKFTTLNGGPLSENGPLGPRGPIGIAYFRDLPKINALSKQLQAAGVWTILGPLGPLGALGPLGPLGPLGGHFSTDFSGNYLQNGRIKRTVDVPQGGGKALSFELVESYSEIFASNFTDNDSSFMVKGTLRTSQFLPPEIENFPFVNRRNQFISMVVVPDNAGDNFGIQLLDASSGKVIASSRSSDFVDWIQIRVPAGKRLVAQVVLDGTNTPSLIHHDYKIIVVGATEAYNNTDIKGPHQLR